MKKHTPAFVSGLLVGIVMMIVYQMFVSYYDPQRHLEPAIAERVQSLYREGRSTPEWKEVEAKYGKPTQPPTILKIQGLAPASSTTVRVDVSVRRERGTVKEVVKFSRFGTFKSFELAAGDLD